MKQNKFLYKERPFIYLAFAILAVLLSPKNMLTYVSCGILIAASFAVFYMRNSYKHKIEVLEKKIAAQKEVGRGDFTINK